MKLAHTSHAGRMSLGVTAFVPFQAVLVNPHDALLRALQRHIPSRIDASGLLLDELFSNGEASLQRCTDVLPAWQCQLACEHERARLPTNSAAVSRYMQLVLQGGSAWQAEPDVHADDVLPLSARLLLSSVQQHCRPAAPRHTCERLSYLPVPQLDDVSVSLGGDQARLPEQVPQQSWPQAPDTSVGEHGSSLVELACRQLRAPHEALCKASSSAVLSLPSGLRELLFSKLQLWGQTRMRPTFNAASRRCPVPLVSPLQVRAPEGECTTALLAAMPCTEPANLPSVADTPPLSLHACGAQQGSQWYLRTCRQPSNAHNPGSSRVSARSHVCDNVVKVRLSAAEEFTCGGAIFAARMTACRMYAQYANALSRRHSNEA